MRFNNLIFICCSLYSLAHIIKAKEDKKKFENPQVYVERGSFKMGSGRREHLSTGEFPIKHIQVKPFAIDRYPVTNADFMIFKKEKPNFLTDAEIKGISWVFVKHKSFRAEQVEDMHMEDGDHWIAVKNATWYQPYGPGSNLEGLSQYPVVHVSMHDAYAFCQWSGKRMTTEYEWEYTARAGVSGNKYPWGNASDYTRSNLWQGRFPDYGLGKDGYEGLAPVNAFLPQNEFGIYDMLGNTWEWTSTVFTVPRVEADRQNPLYTIRGASFVDTYDGRVNSEARISIRKGKSPSFTAQNLGFRCAFSWTPGSPTTPPYRPRQPVHHRYEETWEFKVKRAMQEFVGSAHEGEEL